MMGLKRSGRSSWDGDGEGDVSLSTCCLGSDNCVHYVRYLACLTSSLMHSQHALIIAYQFCGLVSITSTIVSGVMRIPKNAPSFAHDPSPSFPLLLPLYS